ncbi:MAG: hypothetical protein ACTHPS_28890 [Streptosporangiaceae bacterium]
MRRFAIIAVVLAAVAAAGCGASSSPSTRTAAGSATSSAPAEQPLGPADWKLGGAYTGPWPPAKQPMPGPYRAYSLGDVALYVGTPLHSDIPTRAFDCYMNDEQPRPLPAGEYVIPFAITLRGATMPAVWASDPAVTGGDGYPEPYQTTGQNSSQLVWEGSGDCEYPGSTTGTVFGVIGPLTVHQMRHGILYLNRQNEMDESAASFHRPLPLAVPGRALAR